MARLNRTRRDAADEPEEETTSRRSRRSRDDEPDDEPRGRSRRSRDEDPEDEPTRGRRSRRSEPEDEPDEDDEPPARGRRSRSRDEEPEDERPARRGRGRRSEQEDKPSRGRSRGTAGFGEAKAKRVAGGNFAEEFKPHKVTGATLIKFLDDGPFDSFNQHWIEELDKKSYVCHDDKYFDDYEDGCPLCDLGDKPRSYSLFNIVDLSNPRKPVVKVWQTAITVTDMIERLAENKRSSPINRDDLYFEVETTVKNKKYNTVIQIVKADDLDRDFDMDPLEPDEVDALLEEAKDDRTAVTKVESYDELAEIADEIS